MAYENPGESALDYLPCRYGNSRLLFRGPKRRLEGRYVAAIGGTETYGKFVEKPWPKLLETRLGSPVVNFGIVNGGIDVFVNDQAVMEACNKSAVTVVQISGAQNMSNRFYAVHPRRNDRFLRASNLLKTIYRDVDFTEFNFTRHLLSALRDSSAEKFAMVEQELREAWVARMKTMLSTVQSRVVLLWMAGHSPDDWASCGVDGDDPLFVNRDMLDAVAPYCAGIVEVVVDDDERETGIQSLVHGNLEEPAARGMLGVLAHAKAAKALEPVLAELV